MPATQVIESFVRPVVTASPQQSLADVASLMDKQNVGAVVIVDNHRPVGILTDRDLALAVVAHGRSRTLPASAVMATPLRTLTRGEGVFAATLAMKESHARRLPVVDDGGELVGIVTLDDVVRVLGSELRNLLDALEPEMRVLEPTPAIVWGAGTDSA